MRADNYNFGENAKTYQKYIFRENGSEVLKLKLNVSCKIAFYILFVKS